MCEQISNEINDTDKSNYYIYIYIKPVIVQLKQKLSECDTNLKKLTTQTKAIII